MRDADVALYGYNEVSTFHAVMRVQSFKGAINEAYAQISARFLFCTGQRNTLEVMGAHAGVPRTYTGPPTLIACTFTE
jgi:hypothetical protein